MKGADEEDASNNKQASSASKKKSDYVPDFARATFASAAKSRNRIIEGEAQCAKTRNFKKPNRVVPNAHKKNIDHKQQRINVGDSSVISSNEASPPPPSQKNDNELVSLFSLLNKSRGTNDETSIIGPKPIVHDVKESVLSKHVTMLSDEWLHFKRGRWAELHHSLTSDSKRNKKAQIIREAEMTTKDINVGEEGLNSYVTVCDKFHRAVDNTVQFNSVEAIFKKLAQKKTMATKDFIKLFSEVENFDDLVSEQEKKDLIRFFDYEGQGSEVFVPEVKAYLLCQTPIPDFVEKRKQLEKNGKMLDIVKDLKPDFRERIGIGLYGCGEPMRKITTLQEENLRVISHLYHCPQLDVITIQSYCPSLKVAPPLAYVRTMDCVAATKEQGLEKSGEKITDKNKKALELVEASEYIEKHFRLIITKCTSTVVVYSGDEDNGATINIQKPINIGYPISHPFDETVQV